MYDIIVDESFDVKGKTNLNRLTILRKGISNAR